MCCVFFIKAGLSSKNNALPSRGQILETNSEHLLIEVRRKIFKKSFNGYKSRRELLKKKIRLINFYIKRAKEVHPNSQLMFEAEIGKC